jgi:hypothetical protein
MSKCFMVVETDFVARDSNELPKAIETPYRPSVEHVFEHGSKPVEDQRPSQRAINNARVSPTAFVATVDDHL